MRKRCADGFWTAVFVAAAIVLALPAGCSDGGPGARSFGSPSQAPAPGATALDARDCSEPAEGCACAGNQPPVPCRPSVEPPVEPGAAPICFEGTRRCRNGRFGACEDVRAFAAPAGVGLAGLIDVDAEHQPCSDCEPLCFRVPDSFDPADGPLQSGFASGLQYHSSGAGIAIAPSDGALPPAPPPGAVPDGTLYLALPEGLSASASHTSSVRPLRSDVYLLFDRSLGMAQAAQWLYDRFDVGTLLGPNSNCVGGDGSLVDQGLAGALHCMVEQPELGVGMFRDIPFSPYAADQSLSEPARETDARRELAYRHHGAQHYDLSGAKAALTRLDAPASSGDPDVAGSLIPALHAIATGEGMYTGLHRISVPDSPGCTPDRFGYPCFREGGQPIVVAITDAPFHNGPAAGAYDYDPTDLAMEVGTLADPIAVPATNDDFDSAYVLAGNAASTLAVYEGTTFGLAPDVAASVVGCGADELATDAVFGFNVNAPGAPGTTAPVTLSAEGTRFASVLAVMQSPPILESLPASDDSNELFESAHDLGDVTSRHVSISGDTAAAMAADYQGSLFGDACGAHSEAADAVYAFDVASAAAPTELELRLDMGSQHGVLALYEQGAIAPPRWPAGTSAVVTVTGNTDAYPPNVYTIDAGATYVSVRGDTTSLGADFDASVLGGSACSPDSGSPDGAFRIHLDATRRLRFDTEGSQFDTVLSLHDAPPLTVGGTLQSYTAAQTHANANEDAQSAYATGAINGRRVVFLGDTSGMNADLSDRFGCGMDDGCADAVYAIDLTERTTLRLQVDASDPTQPFEPAVVVTRADPASAAPRYAAFALGEEHTCALSGGGVYCWGMDADGQLGNGGGAGDGDSLAAVTVTGVNDAVQLAVGRDHACAVTAAGRVQCWGAGGAGQLGDGGTANRYAPVQVLGFTGGGLSDQAVQVACGAAHCCALAGDGSVRCWGDNANGQLGDDGASGAQSASPVLVAGGERFRQIAASDDHSCAIRASDASVFCWGDGAYGKQGDGAASDNARPTQVTGLSGATHLLCGQDHNCALLASGRVACWGRGAEGRLGQGSDNTDHATPVLVQNFDGSGPFANASAGFGAGRAHTCVTTLEGYVQCWGDNANRQLGNAGTGDAARPTGVHQLLDAVQVAAAYEHSCALRAEGGLRCWGQGSHGKLGSGSTSTPLQPVAAQPGTPRVNFGSGTLDLGFTQACRSRARLPEPGCARASAGDHHYYVCDAQPRSFVGAARSCAAAGYQLAEIDAPGENALLAAELTGPAFIGVRRESSADGLELLAGLDLENLPGQKVWHTDEVGHEDCILWFCNWQPTRGFFTAAAAPDLVDSDPYSSASTWAGDDQPSPLWGRNCATLAPAGKWASAGCSAIVDEPTCSVWGFGCATSIGDLDNGPLEWLGPWIGDLDRLAAESLAGVLAAPHFAAGEEHGYVCEEQGRTTDVTLDPGRYYITVKGADDGVVGNACSGPYALQIEDLGSPSGGFLACDDNGIAESDSSVIERTLAPGDYYLVVKGKRATDLGAYQLTVRDVDAVQSDELACDASAGAGDPATLTFTAEPGKRYYALVKGAAPVDQGSYSLQIRNLAQADQTYGCDASSGLDGTSLLDLALPTGSYYAVLKGRAADEGGNYRLTVGGAAPIDATFEPPSYSETITALDANQIRVATVLSCASSASCTDAQTQAMQLAADTNGTLRQAASFADVPLEVVKAVQLLEAFDSVRGQLVFAPDANPGFGAPTVTAVPDPNNGCSPGADASSFSTCVPGALPSFRVSLTNPALMPVPPAPGPLGAYAHTLRITGERDGVQMLSEDVPVLAAPSGVLPPGSYSSGAYVQDLSATSCRNSTQRPSWDQLTFDADVRPDTRVRFYVCAADSADGLEGCEQGESSSGYKHLVTVTAGGGVGTACTGAADCPDGYCSPYTAVCNELEGASCEQDSDCPGSSPGRCRAGPSAGQIGPTCRMPDLVAQPAQALGTDNYRQFLRVKIELDSLGDGSRTPGVFFWESVYRCQNVE